MTLIRTVLAVTIVLALVGAPVLAARIDPTPGDPPTDLVFAAGPLSDNDNDNGNSNGNANANKNDNGNGNDNNGNSNGNGNDNNGNSNDNDEDWLPPPPPPPPPPPAGVVSSCYSAGESGAITLILPGGSVTLAVVPVSVFPQASEVTLARVDASTAPLPPGARLDEIVFELAARDGCNGGPLGALPADANLSLRYTVSANKAALRFARWDGERWVEVPTAPDPDPGNPYISATVRQTGLYTVYQTP